MYVIKRGKWFRTDPTPQTPSKIKIQEAPPSKSITSPSRTTKAFSGNDGRTLVAESGTTLYIKPFPLSLALEMGNCSLSNTCRYYTRQNLYTIKESWIITSVVTYNKPLVLHVSPNLDSPGCLFVDLPGLRGFRGDLEHRHDLQLPKTKHTNTHTNTHTHKWGTSSYNTANNSPDKSLEFTYICHTMSKEITRPFVPSETTWTEISELHNNNNLCSTLLSLVHSPVLLVGHWYHEFLARRGIPVERKETTYVYLSHCNCQAEHSYFISRWT